MIDKPSPSLSRRHWGRRVKQLSHNRQRCAASTGPLPPWSVVFQLLYFVEVCIYISLSRLKITIFSSSIPHLPSARQRSRPARHPHTVLFSCWFSCSLRSACGLASQGISKEAAFCRTKKAEAIMKAVVVSDLSESRSPLPQYCCVCVPQLKLQILKK